MTSSPRWELLILITAVCISTLKTGFISINVPAVMDIKNDILRTLEDCTNITAELVPEKYVFSSWCRESCEFLRRCCKGEII